MELRRTLNHRFLRQLVSTPKGRAYLLRQVADAEDSGEGRIFDHLASLVDDEELQRMIRRHRDDEVRHAQLFRECLGRTGIDEPAPPPHLLILERLNQALGGFFDKPVEGTKGVMEAYLLLQVIEERALSRFPFFEEILRPYDPATADTFAQVIEDERRHLRYCHAIARRYAPDAETHARTLERFRDLEARVFAENSRANIHYMLDNGYVQLRTAERLLWRGLAALGKAARWEDRTSFGKMSQASA